MQKILTNNLSVAVVGCGYWGKNLVRNFHQLGVLSNVSDIQDDVAVAVGREYNVPAIPLEYVLSDPSIDAVVISAPAVHHYELIRRSISANKHVFVEKPLALTISDAQKLKELVETTDRTVMVGHLLQYHPAYQKLKDICQQGLLGDLRYIYSNRLNLGKFRTEENILWSFAPHDISMILALAGEMPSTVSAIGHAYLNPEISDVTTTHLKFPGGQAAHIHVSWLHPFKEQRLVVIGEDGMVVFDDGKDWSNKLEIYPHIVSWSNGMPQPEKAKTRAIQVDEDEPLKLECQHFLDCITKGIVPRTDVEEGLQVLRVLDAAQKSLDSGQVESL